MTGTFINVAAVLAGTAIGLLWAAGSPRAPASECWPGSA